MNIEQIINFSCPRWDELPSQGLFNREVVSYINQILEPIVDKDQELTETMVQNYSKWQMIPKIKGRKYERIQIAYLLVITIYKQILNIKQVYEGVDNLLSRMDTKEAYDAFAQSLENAIRSIFMPVIDGRSYEITDLNIKRDDIGVVAIAYAFSLKLFSSVLIDQKGLSKLTDYKKD